MTVLIRRSAPPRVHAQPNVQVMLDSAAIAQCPVCRRTWEASAFVQEDGQDRCPRCVDYRTASYKAEVEAMEAKRNADAIGREVVPQLSQASLEDPAVGIVREMTTASGAKVYGSAPLSLARTVAKTLLLLGRDFSSSDTISGSTGLTVSVSARTSTQTTLSVTAAADMTPGDYHLIFNDVYYRDVFRVR